MGALQSQEVRSDVRVPIVLGVTGHRDIRDDDIEHLENKVGQIFEELKDVYGETTPIILLSPLAEGADRLVAKVALKYGCELIVPLPMSQKEYEKDFTTEKSLNDFRDLLSKSKQYFALSHGQTEIIDRHHQYVQVGAYIARHSQILIALWDGVKKDETAGTSKIVEFKLEGVPEPFAPPQKHIDTVDNGPVYHIVTPRRSNPMPNDTPFTLHKKYPINDDRHLNGEVNFNKVLEKIHEFNRDAHKLSPKLSKEIIKNRGFVIPDSKLTMIPDGFQTQLEYYAVSDTLAQYFQKKSMATLSSSIRLVVLAVVILQLYLEMFKDIRLLVPYLLALGAAFVLLYLDRYYKCHEKYLDYRAIAEGHRVQLFWNLSGLNDDASDHYLRKQKSELDWIRFVVRTCNIFTHSTKPPYNFAQSACCNNPLLNIAIKHWIEDQRNYFSDKINPNPKKKKDRKKSERLKHRKRELISTFLYFAGIGLVLVLLLTHNYLSEESGLRHLMLIASAVCIAAAAAVHFHMEKRAFAEHINQYTTMSHLYLRAERKLNKYVKSDDAESVKQVIQEIGKEALIENGDWVLLHRSKPLDVLKG